MLIDALGRRFPKVEVKDMATYHRAYAAAMEQAHIKFPGDANIATLYADALMIEHPWDMWLKDGSSRPWTPAIVQLLERILQSHPDHVGANHMYIHMMEASGAASKAIASADRLRTMLPAAGHLVHMPAHIDIRTGDYHKGVITTENAGFADSNYIYQCRIAGTYPLMYYPHNIHFLAACAFLEGNSAKAIAAAWQVSNNAAKEKTLPENITVQHYLTIPYYVLVQTGKWDKIRTVTAPGSELLYPSAIWNYAQGMADVAGGNLSLAEAKLLTIRKIAAMPILTKQLIWETNSAAQLVMIAEKILASEIASAKKQYSEAEQLLTEAVAIEDKLLYQEPPDWFFSTRHSLGDVYLQQQKWTEAEKIFLEDMKTYPENGWALMGLYKSLSGQGRGDEARNVKTRFDTAWQWSDLTLVSSRIH
ncbi:MAG: hypothetical protein EOP49_29395 [Sphingobacteriales bacterium]|nr:MAG: hypothetical protein EOP49_29395 [Sphingobacteriales bacterium]